MINVWRKAALFDPSKAAVSTWVFSIARNARISRFRKQNRPEPDPTDPAFAPDPAPQPLETVSREQAAGRLQNAVAALPEAQQAVLRLAFFEDKSHAAVAAELGHWFEALLEERDVRFRDAVKIIDSAWSGTNSQKLKLVAVLSGLDDYSADEVAEAWPAITKAVAVLLDETISESDLIEIVAK